MCYCESMFLKYQLWRAEQALRNADRECDLLYKEIEHLRQVAKAASFEDYHAVELRLEFVMDEWSDALAARAILRAKRDYKRGGGKC